MNVDFYFGKSRGDIRGELKQELVKCKSLMVVSGFVTEAGILDFGDSNTLTDKISLMIFGDINGKALSAMSDLHEKLQATGKKNVIKVHLGYGHFPTEVGGISSVFRPMMHSKIFLFHNYDDSYTAYVGSQNITGYSLRGLNSEALVKVSGTIGDKIHKKLTREINDLKREAQYFNPQYLQIYEDWHWNVVNGLVPPRNEKRVYFSILYTFIDKSEKNLPKKGDRLYFEVPEGYSGTFTNIDHYADVWIISRDLNNLSWQPSVHDIFFFRAIQRGVNNAHGEPSRWDDVEWHIPRYKNPIMKRLDGNTKYTGGDVQVFMEFENDFEEVYPGRSYDDIYYYPVLRKERELTPVFANEKYFGLRDSSTESQKPGKDYELIDPNGWSLIEKFREMDEVDRISIKNQSKVLKPINVIFKRDIMKNGIVYKQKVREIWGDGTDKKEI